MEGALWPPVFKVASNDSTVKSPTCEPSSCKEANVKLTSEDLMELEAQKKDEERQEEGEVTKEPNKFMTWEMARGFSLFEEALLVSEAQDSGIAQDIKFAAVVQNTVQSYCVIYDDEGKKKKATIQTPLDHVFKRGDRTESSKKAEPVPSASGMSETAACPPPSPATGDPSVLLSPTSSFSLQSVTLPACSLKASPYMPATVRTTVLFKVLYCHIKNVFFIFVFFLCTICVKTIINLWHHWPDGLEFEQVLVAGKGQGSLASCGTWSCRVGHSWAPEQRQYCVAECVSWVPKPALLDLQTNHTYEHTLGMELVCIQRTCHIHLLSCIHVTCFHTG